MGLQEPMQIVWIRYTRGVAALKGQLARAFLAAVGHLGFILNRK